MRKSVWLVGLDLQMNGVSEALGTFSLGGSQQPPARVGTLQWCSLAASRKRVNWVLDADIRDLHFVTSTVRNERFPSIALNVLHNRVETILTPRSQNDHWTSFAQLTSFSAYVSV